MFKFSTKSSALILAVLITSLGLVLMVQAWTEPSGNPPEGNVAAPINVSGTNQTKDGRLTVGGLTSNANINLKDHDIKDVNDLEVNNIYDGDGGSRIEVRDDIDMNEHHIYDVDRLYTHYLYRHGGGNIQVRDHIDFNDNDIHDANEIKADYFYYISDKRLKEDIKPLQDSAERIMNLKGISFKWKESGEESLGFIAQDVEKVFPKAVDTDEETGLKSINYGVLIAPLVETIKEQQQDIEKLQKEVQELKGELK